MKKRGKTLHVGLLARIIMLAAVRAVTMRLRTGTVVHMYYPINAKVRTLMQYVPTWSA